MNSVETVGIPWSYEDYHEPLSVHVVEADGARVLVGGGDPAIADAVASVGVEYEVDAVLAEHGHVDHYGAIPQLRSRLDIEVAVPAIDAPALRGDGIEPDRTLEPGDSYVGIDCIAAPGHSPGNMAYRYGETLLAGDTVVGSESAFAADEAWSGPLAVIEERFNGDDRQARASVSNLLEWEFDSVRVSHGSNVPDGGRRAVETLVSDLRY